MCLLLQDGFWFVLIPFCSYGQISISCTIPHPIVCLVLYFSVSNLLHSHIMRLWFFLLWEFFEPTLADVLFPGVWMTANHLKSSGLFSVFWPILMTVVWMVSSCPFISKSSSPFNNPCVIVPGVPITIGIIVTFLFHSFLSSLAWSTNLSFFSLSFNLKKNDKAYYSACFFVVVVVVFTTTRFSHLAEIRWSVCISKF